MTPRRTRSTAPDHVCCLACGTHYTKPGAGGTLSRNPGCPDCGYLGWSPVGVSVPRLRDRSVADRRLRPTSQPG